MSIYPTSYNNDLRTYSNGFRVKLVDPTDGYFDTDNPLPISVGDSPTRDAFSRLRVSSPITQLQNVPGYGLNPLNMDTFCNGVGATAIFNRQSNFVLISSGSTNSGNKVIRQTRSYAPYYPGKSQLILMSFNALQENTNNVCKNIGYFDDNNGIFFTIRNNNNFLVWRSSTLNGVSTDSLVHQNDWNFDELNGHGKSRIELDFSKDQIFFVDLQWLGVGRVRAGFVVDGHYQVVHEFRFTNNIETPYMRSGFLPARYEIANTGVANTICNIREICCVVITENSYHNDALGHSFSASTGTQLIPVSTSPVTVLSLRQKNTLNGLPYYGKINLNHLSAFCADQDTFYQIVLSQGSQTGIWTSVNSESGIEYSTSNFSISTSTVLMSGFLSATNKVSSTTSEALPKNFNFGKSYLGTSDIISFVFSSITGNANVGCSISFDEWC